MDANAAAALRKARERAGLTQVQLGERAGLPQSVVSAYERGRREPTLGSLARLVAAAGFDLHLDLVPRAAAPAPFAGPVGRRLQRRRDDARQLLAARNYRSPAVFGSVARGTDTDTSDIDLLIDLPADIGLTQLTRTAIDLATLIGAPVDLVPRAGLRPRVADTVTLEAVPL